MHDVRPDAAGTDVPAWARLDLNQDRERQTISAKRRGAKSTISSSSRQTRMYRADNGRGGRRSIGGYGPRCSARPENPCWGYRRIVGELQSLGISVSATSVRTILIRHGLPPAPQGDELSWRTFLRQHAATTLACDFFSVETAWLKRIHVLFFISLESRRIGFVACTANLTGAWVAQQARSMLMTLDDREHQVRFLIHDPATLSFFAASSIPRPERQAQALA